MCTAWKTSCGKASVVELQEKGKFSDGLLVNALPSILQIPTAPMGRGVTVERNMGMIWESLVNDENEIAASMNLDLSDYMDETRRASKLYAMLTQMKRYVLILDDLWEAFPLEKSLRVLDLSYTRIESLPESISLLANLSELSLDHCVDLSHVPSLEKLKALRKLKLGYTKILELPPGIEELINLKILDLYHTHRLEMLLRGKLAHLSQLKCLRIDRSDIKEFNNYVRSQQWQELTNYRLLLGDDADVESYTIGKEVWVINRHLMSGGGDFLIVPNNILDFKLIRCHDIRSLTEISSLQNARDLKTCYVEYCVGIESIFHSLSSQEEQHYIPKSLENLILPDFPFLRVAFRGVVPPYCTHSNLKKLIIYHSANLRNSWKMILQKEMEFQYILFLFSI
ncbi:hypothetical protein QYF36_009927 [Acer negundo]|nr:hypothetical protein QYF36_009927 [Acer negundo]